MDNIAGNGQKAQTQVTYPVIDMAAALEHTGGDRELLGQLCQVFISESPKQLEELQMAMNSGTPKLIGRAAHKLKGSTLALGGVQASEAALQLERAAENGDMGRVQTGFAALHSAIGALQAAALQLEKEIGCD